MGKFRIKVFRDFALKQTFRSINFNLHVDSSHLCIDINDFVNKLLQIGSNCKKREILTLRKFPAIRYLDQCNSVG